MQDDAALLRDYAKTRSDAAFSELVRRHLNFVYSAALRQVGGDAHLANDVAQSVFCALARKAEAAANVPVLAGWLHTTTHYAAAKMVRTERRRRAREAIANTMQATMSEPAHDAEWARIRPVLDDAIRELRPDDRDAVLLRFFEGEAFAKIGERLRLSENAARMRVDRALAKLGEQLRRRGVHSTGTALAAVLSGQAVFAAPATLTATVTHMALASAASGGAVVSFFQFMALTKTQIALAGALLVAGGAMIVHEQQEQAGLRDELALLQADDARLSRVAGELDTPASPSPELERLRAIAADVPRLRNEATVLREKIARASAARANAQSRPAPARTTPGSSTAPSENTSLLSLDRMPVPKTIAPLVYPFALRQAGISGRAVVSVVIDSDGNVQNAKIVQASHPELESPALESTKQWKFEPGLKGGRAVNTSVQIPLIFTIEPEEQEWF